MIYILHGDDQDASYQKLAKLQGLYNGYEKIYIAQADEESLYLNLFSKGLFESKKILICENLLSAKRFKSGDNCNLLGKTRDWANDSKQV